MRAIRLVRITRVRPNTAYRNRAKGRWSVMNRRLRNSAAPPGISPSQALCQRKMLHPKRKTPNHVSPTIITLNGSESLLIPPVNARWNHVSKRK